MHVLLVVVVVVLVVAVVVAVSSCSQPELVSASLFLHNSPLCPLLINRRTSGTRD